MIKRGQRAKILNNKFINNLNPPETTQILGAVATIAGIRVPLKARKARRVE